VVECTRRILLVVTGLSPQIVTETIFSLAISEEKQFIPTEVHVITTLEGAKRVRLNLLNDGLGHFHALCKEYDLPPISFPLKHIHVINGSLGQPLEDIRTPEDNLFAADFIADLVRNFCQDDQTALHVSIAGGRKSMGFFVGYALSLFGRSQDRMSHVLVNAPFESLSEFYFPPKIAKELKLFDDSFVSTIDARIMLADIPFVRLRDWIPFSLQSGNASFAETVQTIQSGLTFVALEIDYVNYSLCCSGKWIKLPPSLFSFYVWLAQRCKNGFPEGGGISWRDADHKDFLLIYSEIVGRMSPQLELTKKTLQNGFENGEFFEQKVSKINAILKKGLPSNGYMYLISTYGKKPFKKYGLRLLPQQIRDFKTVG
jgi:CRISPR-associated protein (TIGR02584 family)